MGIFLPHPSCNTINQPLFTPLQHVVLFFVPLHQRVVPASRATSCTPVKTTTSPSKSTYRAGGGQQNNNNTIIYSQQYTYICTEIHVLRSRKNAQYPPLVNVHPRARSTSSNVKSKPTMPPTRNQVLWILRVCISLHILQPLAMLVQHLGTMPSSKIAGMMYAILLFCECVMAGATPLHGLGQHGEHPRGECNPLYSNKPVEQPFQPSKAPVGRVQQEFVQEGSIACARLQECTVYRVALVSKYVTSLSSKCICWRSGFCCTNSCSKRLSCDGGDQHCFFPRCAKLQWSSVPCVRRW